MKLNWQVRFNKENMTFVLRFLFALFQPVMVYMGINWDELTTWNKIGEILVTFVTNPYLLGLTVVNGLNMLPDPTTKGISDSPRALSYKKPNETNGGV